MRFILTKWNVEIHIHIGLFKMWIEYKSIRRPNIIVYVRINENMLNIVLVKQQTRKGMLIHPSTIIWCTLNKIKHTSNDSYNLNRSHYFAFQSRISHIGGTRVYQHSIIFSDSSWDIILISVIKSVESLGQLLERFNLTIVAKSCFFLNRATSFSGELFLYVGLCLWVPIPLFFKDWFRLAIFI